MQLNHVNVDAFFQFLHAMLVQQSPLIHHLRNDGTLLQMEPSLKLNLAALAFRVTLVNWTHHIIVGNEYQIVAARFVHNFLRPLLPLLW